jgi:hypothetical protein
MTPIGVAIFFVKWGFDNWCQNGNAAHIFCDSNNVAKLGCYLYFEVSAGTRVTWSFTSAKWQASFDNSLSSLSKWQLIENMFLLIQCQSVAIYRFGNPFANLIGVSLRNPFFYHPKCIIWQYLICQYLHKTTKGSR